MPGVNHLGVYGRWAFAELTDVYTLEEDFEDALKAQFHALVERAASRRETADNQDRVAPAAP